MGCGTSMPVHPERGTPLGMHEIDAMQALLLQGRTVSQNIAVLALSNFAGRGVGSR